MHKRGFLYTKMNNQDTKNISLSQLMRQMSDGILWELSWKLKLQNLTVNQIFLQTWAPCFICVLNTTIPFVVVFWNQCCTYQQTFWSIHLHRNRPPPDDPTQMSGLRWGICPSSSVYIYERIMIGPLPPATSDPSLSPHVIGSWVMSPALLW